jgi:hypothetical protein
MRILHIAPFNTAGVPLAFVKAERKLGYESRLITLGKNPQKREEDICLNLPFLDNGMLRCIKNMVTPKARRTISHSIRIPKHIPVQWIPGNTLEARLFRLREKIWGPKIYKAMKKTDFWNYDVYQLDGGLEFYRDGRTVRLLKKREKKVLCCYTGSDLRIRGVIPEIDRLADLNLTVEFDHLGFHPDIHHVPFPLDISLLPSKPVKQNTIIRIGHAPTNRAAKGSDTIIGIVNKLSRRFQFEFVLIENLPYTAALEKKVTCDIFIDQIGNLGYGMNGIESLAMGIPACSSLAPGFTKAYPDHPFQEINETNLESVLISLIRDSKKRDTLSKQGKKWVRRVHDSVSVVQKIHHLSGLA